MAYQMARLPVTLGEAVLKLCDNDNSGNIACFNSVCLQMNWKAHAACDLSIIVKG